MKYDFTSIMDRHGKDATAIDGLGSMPGFTPDLPKEGYDVIPMWVADMNFPTVPTIPEAIIERAKHPAYGYFQPTDEYFDSIIKVARDPQRCQGSDQRVHRLRKRRSGRCCLCTDLLCRPR